MKKNGCPISENMFDQYTYGGNIIKKWWPDQLNLKILHQNRNAILPYDKDFGYKEAFAKLDYDKLKVDLKELMINSQEWWPADWGHYGPFFIRMAWHSAGTYRVMDGRGGGVLGAQRFAPQNSWPDNANLDKARRLLWPIKKKYGNAISWADLILLAGNVALESMGFKTLGFACGREDIWEHQEDIYWGPEAEWLADERRKEDRQIENPLAAVQMGLIYVNPEGPDGVPDALAAAKDIRMSFGRMGMNDEETVALIAGGHTFGKCHGAADPGKYVGPEPEAVSIEQQGLGWKNSYKSGKGADTITSGIEGAWTPTPTKWDNSFLETLFKYDWNLEKSPAGAWQWTSATIEEKDFVSDAHIEGKMNKSIMLTTDLALRFDPKYKEIALRFIKNPQEFQEAFAKAWFKLIHRDLGPKTRYLGPEVPKEDFLWQDPLPSNDSYSLNEAAIQKLKEKIRNSKLTQYELIYTVWSAASTYRHSDRRGGANGTRIALAPQNSWEVNQPDQLEKVLNILKQIQNEFEQDVSLADLIILGGVVGIEEGIKKAGLQLEVPYRPGRVDATQEMTDKRMFEYLRPVADGFRNYIDPECKILAEKMLLDKAHQLNLTVPEMTVLIGGMRALGINYKQSSLGIFDDTGILDNRFFVHLLDMNIKWEQSEEDENIFLGYNRKKGKLQFRASRIDLIFGANSQLRAQAEFYAQDEKKEKFVRDFVKTWTKVTELDRFDLHLTSL